ncbi:hypothetical protein IW262DRAFT_1493266 [Armillaria fumosa]|nr:hypothetical protein IW262DRAFT_1493266 [Armillaria fumosa]
MDAVNNCRSHQSYYTALSRTATAAGTLLLPSIGNKKLLPIDANKIQGGCSGWLRQEFRELELLDEITLQQYEGALPVDIAGDTRYELIESFRSYSDIDPFDPTDATELGEWAKVHILHRLSRAIVQQDTAPPIQAGVCRAQPLPQPAPLAKGNVTSGANRIFTPMKSAAKHKARSSDTNSGPHAPHTGPEAVNHSSDVIGCRWSNNSCAFDATIFILYNLWNSGPARCSRAFELFGNCWMAMLASSFSKFADNKYTLEEVRDFFRRRLNRDMGNMFAFGNKTSVEALLMQWTKGNAEFTEVIYQCADGHIRSCTTHFCAVIEPGSTADIQERNLPYRPPIIGFPVSFTRTVSDPTITTTVGGEKVPYRLGGIIYFGERHYMARFVDNNLEVWYNDGIVLGRRAVLEGKLVDIDLTTDRAGKSRDQFIYIRADL